jgi:GTPase involved in cell partitioning and DNA repair
VTADEAVSRLVADPDSAPLRLPARHGSAARGENGRGSGKHGADGETVTLRVPVGTQVFDGEGT